MPLKETLFCPRLLFALHRHGHAGRDSDYVNGSDCAHVTVEGIWCVEEVGDHHGQETGLKRDFYSSRKKWTFGSGPLLCQRFRRRREEAACKRKRTEISLVFVTIMLHVLMYVVSNKLFWNWNGVVRFVSQEVWRDKGFVIWNFFNYCWVQIVSLWSLSIGAQIIFTTDNLVDRIKILEWNASPNDQEENFLWKECAAGQILKEMKCAAGKTYQTKCAAGWIFWLSPHGYSVLLMQ